MEPMDDLPDGGLLPSPDPPPQDRNLQRETAIRRLRKLVEAVNKESPCDGIHGGEVEELYELGTDVQELGATDEVSVPRYLGCASEGHFNSTYRSNPNFHVADAAALEEWLAGQYVEGWAARWVIDLDAGEALSWRTVCTFDQEVERRVEPAYAL